MRKDDGELLTRLCDHRFHCNNEKCAYSGKNGIQQSRTEYFECGWVNSNITTTPLTVYLDPVKEIELHEIIKDGNDTIKDGNENIRTFVGGATRDSDDDKLDFEGFFNPLVFERYATYLHKHRKQSDGKLRTSDNWQNLFGEKHKDVCIKSLIRHTVDVWLHHRGFSKKVKNTLQDSLCAIIFNASAYLLKLLKDEYETMP